MIVEIPISSAARAAARTRAARALCGGREPHQYGRDRIRIAWGYLGEEMVAEFLGVPVVDHPDYDLIFEGRTYDIKTVAPCAVAPRPFYKATVNNSTTGDDFRVQRCDRYIFARIVNDPIIGYACGWYDATEFHRLARFVRRGEEYAPGRRATEADMRVMPITSLGCLNSLRSGS